MGRDRNQRKLLQKAFVSTSWKVLNSEAYKQLPSSAAKALPYFLGRPHVPYSDPRYLQTVFPFTYPEATRLGFATATWATVLRDLVKFGFIDPVSKGGLRGMGKTSAQFRLSDRWQLYGKEDFEPINLKTWCP